jgi:TPR repeat protein
MPLPSRTHLLWLSCLFVLGVSRQSDAQNRVTAVTGTTNLPPAVPSTNAASATKPPLDPNASLASKTDIANLQASVAKGDADAQYHLGDDYDFGKGIKQDIAKAIELYKAAAAKGNMSAEMALGLTYWQGRGAWVSDPPKGNDPYAGVATPTHWQQVVSPDYKQAVDWFQKASAKGSSSADWALGQCYFNGNGVEKNVPKAIEFYRESAAQNDPLGELALGAAYATGTGVEKDPVASANLVAKSAQQGNAEAEYVTGWNYINGFGLDTDAAQGVAWYQKSAAQANFDAAFNLAMCYFAGIGVAPDRPKAVKTISALAQMGYVEAENKMGVLCEMGSVIPQDYSQAATWYRKAADAGKPEAQTSLGQLYASGQGVGQDLTEAVRWYWKAAQQGDLRAEFLLYTAYYNGTGVKQDRVEAMKLLSDSANRGFPGAETLMGVACQYGNGVPADLVAAFNWYSKAAQQGTPMAEESLASCYQFGTGTYQNIPEAFKWYKKSAMSNYYPGQCGLGFMYLKGEGVLKDEVEGMAWLYLGAANGNAYVADTLLPQYERMYGADVAVAARNRAKQLQDQIAEQQQGDQSTTTVAASASTATPHASGTGEFLTADGWVLTAAHVVHGAARIEIVTATGKSAASVAKVDESNDVALLKCTGSGFIPIAIAPSKDVRMGDTVFTLGFPNIQIQGFDPKLTKGEISSATGIQDDPRSWQISVPIQPGNSGGPLCDENGNLVGIVESTLDPLTMAKLAGEIPQNVNYAVKSSYITPLLDDVQNLPQPRTGTKKSFEDVVQSVRPSTVLILVY